MALSNDKTNTFSNEFAVLYSRENSPWMGGVQNFTSSGRLFPGDFGRKLVLQKNSLGEAAWKQGMIGQEVRHFLVRLSGPIF